MHHGNLTTSSMYNRFGARVSVMMVTHIYMSYQWQPAGTQDAYSPVEFCGSVTNS